MFVNSNFIFNDTSSTEMGVMLIRESSESSIIQKFSPDKATYKDRPRYRDSKTFYYGSDKQILTLTIKISKIPTNNQEDMIFSYNDRVNLMKWLCPDNQFHPLISADYPDTIFWIQFIKTSFTNYFSNQGFITLEAESYLPYPTSPLSYREFNLESNTTSTIIEVSNISNVVSPYMPIIEFTLCGTNTSFKIINHTNGGAVFDFGNALTIGETIIVNNETMEIISDKSTERISAFNMGFLKLIYGDNQLEVFGACTLRILCQFPMQI